MIASGVTDDDHRAARAESVAPVALPERLEHAPVVAVAVVADHAAGLEQLPRLDRPVGRSHQRADLVDRVDEGERARRPQLVGQRRDQRQCEPGEVGHRSRHVAEHEQFGTMCARAAIDDVERDPAGGEGSVDRVTDVDPPGTDATVGGGAVARRAGGRAGGSRRGRRRARSPRRGPARRRTHRRSVPVRSSVPARSTVAPRRRPGRPAERGSRQRSSPAAMRPGRRVLPGRPAHPRGGARRWRPTGSPRGRPPAARGRGGTARCGRRRRVRRTGRRSAPPAVAGRCPGRAPRAPARPGRASSRSSIVPPGRRRSPSVGETAARPARRGGARRTGKCRSNSSANVVLVVGVLDERGAEHRAQFEASREVDELEGSGRVEHLGERDVNTAPAEIGDEAFDLRPDRVLTAVTAECSRTTLDSLTTCGPSIEFTG